MVAEGQTIDVELLHAKGKTVDFEALMVIDGDKTTVGTPTVAKVKVTAEVVNEDTAGQKVTAIRYKPKKRVHTVRGHRQHYTQIKITKIV